MQAALVNGLKWRPCDALGVTICCRAMRSVTVQLSYQFVGMLSITRRTFTRMAEDGWFFLVEEELLVSLLDKAGGVCGPGRVLRNVGPQELEVGDVLDSHPIVVHWIMCALPS